MSKQDRSKAAAEQLAADIATKAEPGLARVLSGGKSQVPSEMSHRIAMAIARDMDDHGRAKSTEEYIREAKRK